MLKYRLLIIIFIVLVFFALALASANENLTDPYLIYNKYLEALGGLEKLKNQKTTYLEGKITMVDMSGPYKEWKELPQKYRIETDLGVFKETLGDNGRFQWVKDTNGKVNINKDNDTINRRKINVLMNRFEHIKLGSTYFRMTLAGVQAVNGRPCYVIRISNTINNDIQSEYIDRQNFHLEQSVQKQPDSEIHTRYSDYRDVDGVLRPYRLEVTELPLNQTHTLHVTRWQTGKPIPPSLFELPQEDPRDFTFPEGSENLEVPFQFIDNHLYLTVEIKGSHRLWCVDTGAEMSVIDLSYAKELGLQPKGNIKGQGAAHEVQVSFITLPPYRVKTIRFKEQRVASIPIRELFERLDLEVVGILGYDFLSRFISKIDYASRQLTFYLPETFKYTGTGKILKTPLRSNMFSVPMTVDGKYSGYWSLDIGAGSTDFHYPFAKENGFLKGKGIDRLAQGAGGSFITREQAFDNLELGGFVLQAPLIESAVSEVKGSFSQKELIGNLGNSVLRHFVLYLDYSRQQVIIEKGKDFQRRFPIDKSGLQTWLTKDKAVEVVFVSPTSPAARAGFETGDRIVSVNGKNMAAIGGLMALKALFKEKAGTLYTIAILRQGKAKVLKLKLTDLF